MPTWEVEDPLEGGEGMPVNTIPPFGPLDSSMVRPFNLELRI